MNTYKVEKAFEQFAIGDEIVLNRRQAKYRLMSGHLVPCEVQTDIADVVKTDNLADVTDEASHTVEFVKQAPVEAVNPV